MSSYLSVISGIYSVPIVASKLTPTVLIESIVLGHVDFSSHVLILRENLHAMLN